MFRTLCAALLVLAFIPAGLFAGDYKGTLQKVDNEQMLLVVRVAGKNVTCKITRTTRFLTAQNDVMKEGSRDKRLRAGVEVRFFTEQKGGKGEREVVNRLQLTQ